MYQELWQGFHFLLIYVGMREKFTPVNIYSKKPNLGVHSE